MVVRMLRAIGSIEGEDLHTKVICKRLHAGINSQGKSYFGSHRCSINRVYLDSRAKAFQVAKLLDWHPRPWTREKRSGSFPVCRSGVVMQCTKCEKVSKEGMDVHVEGQNVVKEAGMNIVPSDCSLYCLFAHFAP